MPYFKEQYVERPLTYTRSSTDRPGFSFLFLRQQISDSVMDVELLSEFDWKRKCERAISVSFTLTSPTSDGKCADSVLHLSRVDIFQHRSTLVSYLR